MSAWFKLNPKAIYLTDRKMIPHLMHQKQKQILKKQVT